MTLKPDSWIEKMVLEHDMIEPFSRQLVQQNVISYGLSSYGYDVSTADEFKIFLNVNAVVIDPKNFDERSFVEGKIHDDERGRYCIIPPNSFALARSVEYIRMLPNVTGLMTTKSSYARCGIVSPPTVLEAGWEGHITIEISNTNPLPARIYANEGIAQVLFFMSDEPCMVTYADRKGKYQGQTGITLPKMDMHV